MRKVINTTSLFVDTAKRNCLHNFLYRKFFVNRSAAGFCILILCLATLADLISSEFFVEQEKASLHSTITRERFFPSDYDDIGEFFIYGVHCVEISFFYSYFIESFCHELVLNLVEFFCIY
jgi:hypothetical protein